MSTKRLKELSAQLAALSAQSSPLEISAATRTVRHARKNTAEVISPQDQTLDRFFQLLDEKKLENAERYQAARTMGNVIGVLRDHAKRGKDSVLTHLNLDKANLTKILQAVFSKSAGRKLKSYEVNSWIGLSGDVLPPIRILSDRVFGFNDASTGGEMAEGVERMGANLHRLEELAEHSDLLMQAEECLFQIKLEKLKAKKGLQARDAHQVMVDLGIAEEKRVENRGRIMLEGEEDTDAPSQEKPVLRFDEAMLDQMLEEVEQEEKQRILDAQAKMGMSAPEVVARAEINYAQFYVDHMNQTHLQDLERLVQAFASSKQEYEAKWSNQFMGAGKAELAEQIDEDFGNDPCVGTQILLVAKAGGKITDVLQKLAEECKINSADFLDNLIQLISRAMPSLASNLSAQVEATPAVEHQATPIDFATFVPSLKGGPADAGVRKLHFLRKALRPDGGAERVKHFEGDSAETILEDIAADFQLGPVFAQAMHEAATSDEKHAQVKALARNFDLENDPAGLTEKIIEAGSVLSKLYKSN